MYVGTEVMVTPAFNTEMIKNLDPRPRTWTTPASYLIKMMNPPLARRTRLCSILPLYWALSVHGLCVGPLSFLFYR